MFEKVKGNSAAPTHIDAEAFSGIELEMLGTMPGKALRAICKLAQEL